MSSSDPEEEDQFGRGFYGIPSEEELKQMSLLQLASLLASSKSGSEKHLVIQYELSGRRDAETLTIAKEANRLALEANEIARVQASAARREARYAMYAAVVAAVAAIAANSEAILALVSNQP